MIYTTGTIAVNGNTVTGTGTNFSEPLSLIRVGCTLIAIGNPVQIFTITEIKSGTELSVTPAANPAIAAGTKFSILLSDSISVDGLAQDVAETLRYYQSKETQIEEALEFFKNFDIKQLHDLVNQVKGDAEKTSADRAATEQLKNDTQQIKDSAVTETNNIKADTDAIKAQTQQIKDSAVVETEAIKQEAFSARDQAELARDTAGNHATDANNAKHVAETARDEARQWAQQVQPENMLHKDRNLGDVTDKALARINLQLDRFNQGDGETFIQSPDKIKHLTVGNDGWGYWNAKSQQFVPLGVQRGGTGGTTDEEARNNLKIDKFVQTESDTRILSQSKNHTFFIADADWGYLDNSNSERVPLPIISGGTGATTAEQACLNLHALKYDYPSTTEYSLPEIPTGIGFYRNDNTPSPYPGGNGAPFNYAEIMTIADGGGSGNWSQIAFPLTLEFVPKYRQRLASPARITNWRDFLVRDLNTTVDVNGYVKIASPIVKIKGDGTAEFNDESEGCVVTRVSKGVYVVSGCLGLNADAAWGGIDGGFEIPMDINKQPRVWLDYKVLADGSIEIRTYHRTHTNAPEFARNIIDGIADGDPVDIPPGTYISVRVQMPATGL